MARGSRKGRTVERGSASLLGRPAIVNHELIVDEDLSASDEGNAKVERPTLFRFDEAFQANGEELGKSLRLLVVDAETGTEKNVDGERRGSLLEAAVVKGSGPLRKR